MSSGFVKPARIFSLCIGHSAVYRQTPSPFIFPHSLVHVFHTIPHTGISVGGLYTITMLISRGMVRYHPTTTIIELCRFIRPHKSGIRSVHNQMHVQGSTMKWSLINTGGGYHLEASNIHISLYVLPIR
jgi:hypothetical protein